MGITDFLVALGSGGLGFLAADGVDRFLATYNPSSTDPLPTDKFTSNGSGTMANALNVASRPGWKRGAAAAGMVVVPAGAAYFLKNRTAKTVAEGVLIGTAISGLKMLVNSFVMPMLIGKDTSNAALQKSIVVRMFPAESAAFINKANVPSTAGALSGAKDVGPFALQGDSPYDSAADALRRGVGGDSPYDSAADALRRGVGGDSPYDSAAQALRNQAGMSASPTASAGVPYTPGVPPGAGPGPQANKADPDCGCMNASNPFLGFIGGTEEATA